MKNLIKKFISLLVILFGAAMIYAADTDSFEITCTPILTYSVTISTPATGLSFNVEPGQSYVYSSTVTVKNTGNVSADWTISGISLNTWTLGATPGPDTVRLLGVFKTSLANSGDFDVSLDTITATESNMKNPNYYVDEDGNDVPKNGTRLLSIRLDAPTDTSVDTEQKFRIEIKAYPSSKF